MISAKNRMPPIPGDVPHGQWCLGSEVDDARIEGIVVVTIGIRYCFEAGVLHAVSVEAGIYDLTVTSGPVTVAAVSFFCFSLGPALGAPFGGRTLRGFFCFCRQDCRPGDAGLSSEELHNAEKTGGQYG